MLVYREQRRMARPAERLLESRRQLLALAPGHQGARDRVLRVLIDVGVLEAAIADEACPDVETLAPGLAAWRHASVLAGHLAWHSRRGDREAMRRWAVQLDHALGRLADMPLPEHLVTRVPEGFAQYGLDPMGYAGAAEELTRTLQPGRATCVGIRSIGTTLSAVVAATLEELGCEVLTLTVRPHGHPFDRRPRFGADVQALLRSRTGDLFLVVDEGPGLSGSSLAGTAAALAALGIGDERIVLMPSWDTDGAGLRSDEARRRWVRHRRFPAEPWSGANGALSDVQAAGRTVQDLSAGRWRRVVYRRSGEYPAVHQQHERRKYLVDSANGRPAILYRFAGFGRYGDGKLERAGALAAAGFGPTPLAIEGGFLGLEFSPGRPVTVGEPDTGLLAIMARYLAHLQATFPASEHEVYDLDPVLRLNVAEGLGDEGMSALERRLAMIDAVQASPTALDARMLPHEWVCTGAGYRKTDALDHHDDHFLPGPQDLAWDVAGTCLEFGLAGGTRRAFIDRYRRAGGDRDIAARLPYHALTYLACRLGYAALAAETLADSPDGRRFRARAEHYCRLLWREITASVDEWQG